MARVCLVGYTESVLITISGEPGSGKTTVGRLLAKRLRLPYVYAGDLYRQEAKSRSLSLGEFNKLCEMDHSIDRALDDKMALRARQGNVVLEGRLAGFLAAEASLKAVKAWLTASDEVRARRVAEREDGDWHRILLANQERHASDAKRYKEIYGYDLADTRVYDIVLSTDHETPTALVECLIERAQAVFGPGE